MEVAVVALLALGGLVYVAAPLFGRRAALDPRSSSAVAEATGRKRTALGAIVELESDRAVGKLSDEDFEELELRYEAEAVDALRALDALDAIDATSDDDLEREIARIRARLECPSCGAPRSRGSTCPRCGAGEPS
jgi:hypothetical protein